ncbi:hypothetical protein [Paenibacillus taihuensis]|nr:hypothetical protein [Paenibacillus taihuensis]
MISFRASGNASSGFYTEIMHDGKTLARHNNSGELSLLLENGDRADREEIHCWRAEEAVETEGGLLLRGKMRLNRFSADLGVTVHYEQVTDRVIKKTVRLHQNDIPRLYVAMRNSLEPARTPRSYWSFDHNEHHGGPAYGILAEDVYPAAGFVSEDGLMVGLLTDSGWSNKWSRLAWRRTSRGNTAAIQVTDPAILRTATLQERAEGRHHVTLALGESYGHARIPYENGGNGRYAFLGRRGYRYAIAMEWRGQGVGTVVLCDCDGNSLSKLDDDNLFAGGRENWQSYVGRTGELHEDGHYSFFVDESSGLDSREVRIFESAPETVPWHELRQGEDMVRTAFIFAEQCDATPRDVRLHSQLKLAEGLGFQGSDLEKVLYADFKMLTWVTEPGVDEPLVVPSTFYFEMYFRDVFWMLNGSKDAFLNENILRRIGETMNERHEVDNIITGYHGSIEHTDNEMSYIYLIWSYLNQKRFGIAPDMEKVKQSFDLITGKFDPDGDGVIVTNNPQSAMDIMWQNHKCRFASSQGYYAVALMAAQKLGIPVADAYIQSAVEAYRGYYAEYGSDGKFVHNFPDNQLGKHGEAAGIIANIDLEPEFLSAYLFDRPMLDSQMVIDTLEKYPVSPEGLMPNLCKVDGTRFTKDVNPFNGGHFWPYGIYANGASWLRKQYIVLAAGKYHGWTKADEIMNKRCEAELNFDADQPLSREYLSLTGDPKQSAPHRVFGWNLIVLSIHEWFGSRKPDWDPDFSPRKETA